MAEAILHSLHANKTQNMENVHVFDIKLERSQYLKSKYGITVSNNVASCIENAEILLLAVKPQSLDQIAAEITSPPSGMVLSILAGCPIATLQEKLRTKQVMRTMPNTPAMISEGMTVWIASKDTPQSLKEKGQILLQSIGEEVEVHEEKYLDMATAISGSGPAVSILYYPFVQYSTNSLSLLTFRDYYAQYVFLTMEAMIDAGVHMGFPRDTATKLVLATLRGSSSYALQSHSSVQTLKSNVRAVYACGVHHIA